ncbi:MAG: hypothetical protein QG595_1956 [Pseudomonadota bacterium]|nr:hypothetical protein [Pseudomonadota bacterium]
MAVETIPAATAKQICKRLYSVATMLRGMRMLAASAEEKNVSVQPIHLAGGYG